MKEIIIDSIDNEIYEKIRENWDKIAKPIDGLGDFESLICKIGAITKKEYPDISKRALIIMCADNGVVKEGISQCGQEVTKSVVELMAQNKSSVGIMTADNNIDAVVVDIGVNCDNIPGTIDRKIVKGTNNFLDTEAMTKEQCMSAIETGIQTVRDCAKKGYGIIITGEMGIGNTTTSTALMCALTGIEPQKITGAGAGLSKQGIKHKIDVINQGLLKHNLVYEDSPLYGSECDAYKCDIKRDETIEYVLRAMRQVGGLDIAGLAGVFIGGAIYHVPVIIDGFISAVAAFAAELLCPGTRQIMIASHVGKEKATAILLEKLGLKAIINANMALGEGTGAVMMIPLLDMVYRLYLSGTDFGNTSIERYERFE